MISETINPNYLSCKFKTFGNTKMWETRGLGKVKSGTLHTKKTKKNRKEEDPELEAKPRITLQTHSFTKEISTDLSQPKVGNRTVTP